jgi:hypothetical protein
MPESRRKLFWPTFAAMSIAVGIIVAVFIWRAVCASNYVGLINAMGVVPSSTLVANLASSDIDVQRESLAALAENHDPAGLAHAA